MPLAARNYWLNLLKLLRRDHLLRPLAVTYYLTTRCNLNCTYCEDFGARRNPQAETELPLDGALRVLRVVRQATDRLILTGGEPLLYPDIVRLATDARHKLGFRHITLLTNSLLLPQREEILPVLDRLVISLDATDPDFWQQIIQAPRPTAQAVIDNVRRYARRQGELGYTLIANCVLTPDTLPGARQVLEFCVTHGLLVSFSPQSVHYWPRYDLLVSPEYHAFLSELIALKRRGAPIVGSTAYLRTLRDMAPFDCHPTLIPRIMPNGDLTYPCRPIEAEKGAHGGRPCNLTRVESWEQALSAAVETYGLPPRGCTSCFQQCYAEPSLMQTHPLALLGEMLRYGAARRGSLWTHAPG